MNIDPTRHEIVRMKKSIPFMLVACGSYPSTLPPRGLPAAASFYTVTTGTTGPVPESPLAIPFVLAGPSFGTVINPTDAAPSATEFRLARGTYLLEYQVVTSAALTLSVTQDGVPIESSAVSSTGAGTVQGSQLVSTGGSTVFSIKAVSSGTPSYGVGISKLNIVQLTTEVAA